MAGVDDADSGKFAAFLDSRQEAAVWIDCRAYARTVLDNGRGLPWSDVAELIGALRRRDQLIGSDVVDINLFDFVTDWLDANPDFAELASGKRRPTAPLRMLLGQDGLRSQLCAALAAISATFANRMVVLTVAAPSTLLKLAWGRCHGATPAEFDTSHVEAAAAYLADLLREIDSAALAGVLVVHDPEFDTADCRAPVQKVARFRGWSYGMLFDQRPESQAVGGLDFAIAADPVDPAVLWGRSLASASWGGEDSPHIAPAVFAHTKIPGDANPGHVLERVAVLRAAAADSNR